MSDLTKLNITEPKDALIRRLKRQANRVRKPKVSIIDALEFRREQYGLTATEFASILGFAQTHYSEFVNGKRRLPRAAMCRAFAIGVPAEVLLHPTATRAGRRGDERDR